jgi:crotonobetainyl-CoA:carnitine CoA-transferase CaiB-like acyl-CoA transferase
MPGPLFGIRVVDLTTQVLGPLASQTLGDMGADVIKVEMRDGDPIRRQGGPSRHAEMSSLFLMLNRNKRSIRLDLKLPECRLALARLVENADVFMHNMRPKAAEKLQITYADIAAKNPNVVYASASGFSAKGRYRDKPAFDDIIQGASGVAALNAGPDGDPRYLPMLMADKLVGMYFAMAISMALFARERTGVGQEVHVPMLESMLSFNLVEHLWGGVFGTPEAGLGYGRLFARRPFATSDGHVCIMASTDRQWQRLFELFEIQHLVTDPRFETRANRTSNIGALYEIVAGKIRARSTAEWLEILAKADVPSGPVKTLQNIWDDDYLKEINFFRPFEHPTEGKLFMTDIPFHFSKTPGNITRGVPNLGEHTTEILGEIGYSKAEISALNAAFG